MLSKAAIPSVQTWHTCKTTFRAVANGSIEQHFVKVGEEEKGGVGMCEENDVIVQHREVKVLSFESL